MQAAPRPQGRCSPRVWKPALLQAQLLGLLRGREPSVILASVNACADLIKNCHQRAKENIPTVPLDMSLRFSFCLQVSFTDVEMDSPELDAVSVMQ